MNHELVKIKNLLLHGRYRFSEHAENQMYADGLNSDDAVISVINALHWYKKEKDGSNYKYVFISPTLDNIWVYSVGKIILDDDGRESYYFYITAHRSE